MRKDFYIEQDIRLLTRQRILMRTFVVNTFLVLLTWFFSFIPGFLFMGALITGVPGAWFYYLMMCGLALWELIAVIFFFAPAMAIAWLRRTNDKEQENTRITRRKK